eukprot:gene57584-biopygen58704
MPFTNLRSRVRNSLRPLTVTTGGAKPGEELLEWMRRVFGAAAVSNSYGSSEAGGIAANGRLFPGVEARLAAWGDFTPHDTPHPRESKNLQSLTAELFSGYVGDDAAGVDADGFLHAAHLRRVPPTTHRRRVLHTGDVVEMRAP